MDRPNSLARVARWTLLIALLCLASQGCDKPQEGGGATGATGGATAGPGATAPGATAPGTTAAPQDDGGAPPAPGTDDGGARADGAPDSGDGGVPDNVADAARPDLEAIPAMGGALDAADLVGVWGQRHHLASAGERWTETAPTALTWTLRADQTGAVKAAGVERALTFGWSVAGDGLQLDVFPVPRIDQQPALPEQARVTRRDATRLVIEAEGGATWVLEKLEAQPATAPEPAALSGEQLDTPERLGAAVADALGRSDRARIVALALDTDALLAACPGFYEVMAKARETDVEREQADQLERARQREATRSDTLLKVCEQRLGPAAGRTLTGVTGEPLAAEHAEALKAACQGKDARLLRLGLEYEVEGAPVTVPTDWVLDDGARLWLLGMPNCFYL